MIRTQRIRPRALAIGAGAAALLAWSGGAYLWQGSGVPRDAMRMPGEPDSSSAERSAIPGWLADSQTGGALQPDVALADEGGGSTPGEAAPVADLLAALRAHDLPAARELLLANGDPSLAIEALVDLVLSADDLVAQLMAIQILASLPGEGATRALLRLAQERSLGLRARKQALLGAGAQADPSNFPELLGFLMSDERELRLAAIQAAGLRGGPSAWRALESAIWREEDAGLRRAGFQALAALDSPETFDALLALLERESDGSAVDRDAVLGALGTFTSAEVVPALLDTLARADDRSLRAALVRSLSHSRDPRAFDTLLRIAADPAAGPARLEAINGLGLLGDTRAVPLLRQIGASGDTSEQRYSDTAIARILGAKL